MYYEINEKAAATARQFWSFREYKDGSCTAEYRSQVDRCYQIAKEAKAKTDESKHDYIDYLADKFAKKLAEYYNKDIHIQMMCPSVMVAGPANFSVKKKERQNRADEKNRQFYNYVMGIMDKIENICNGSYAINSADPKAIDLLEEKIKDLETKHEYMKAANVHWRKNHTMKDFDDLTDEKADILDKSINDSLYKVPYATYELQYNKAAIKAAADRLERLKKIKAAGDSEYIYTWGKVVNDTTDMRIRFIFDGKPEPEIRDLLKSNGFKWSPKNTAWQRQNTNNGIYAAKQVIKKLEEIYNAN